MGFSHSCWLRESHQRGDGMGAGKHQLVSGVGHLRGGDFLPVGGLHKCISWFGNINLYLDAGVREYWIVDPAKTTVVVYHLAEEQFKMTVYTFHNKIKSGIYGDLWIDLKELDL